MALCRSQKLVYWCNRQCGRNTTAVHVPAGGALNKLGVPAGRLNHVASETLPPGEWPQYCPTCRASGLMHCSACLATGRQRERIGFRIPEASRPTR